MLRPFTYDPPATPVLPVIHADDAILVLDKPAGLLTVPGKDPSLADCLESRAQQDYPSARIVHRLDKDTSGVIVLGLTAKAHAHLGLQFEKRQTSKTYVARVAGRLAPETGIVDAPITTDWPNRPMQHIDRINGRPAVTRWTVETYEHNATRVRLVPETGRSHQLRVHMHHLGHAILGDNLYAGDADLNAAPRLQLHALSLGFRHPETGVNCAFEAPCPF